VVADGGGGIEQAAQGQQPRRPRFPPGGDKEDEGELAKFGEGDAGVDAEDLRDPALDDVGFNVGAVEAEVDEGGNDVGGGAYEEDEELGPIGAGELARMVEEAGEFGLAGEDGHRVLITSLLCRQT
jgi:hypothetical protein